MAFEDRVHLGGSVFSFFYNAEAVACLKEVSSHARAYDPETRVWWVNPDYSHHVHKRLLRILGATGFQQWAVGDEGPKEERWREQERERQQWSSGNRQQQTSRPPPPNSREAALAQLHLREGAPPKVVKAVYRVLAGLHHPDKPGGDTEKMKRINLAFEVLSNH